MNYESKGNEEAPSLGGNENAGDFKNSRTEIDMVDPSSRTQFVGLSKEELARYENDPFWKKIRLGLLLAFWAIWLILLVTAVLLLVRTPKCPKVYNLKWSRKYPGYAICVGKFAAPLVGTANDQAAELAALADKLTYVDGLDFGYVTLYDAHLPPYNEDALKANLLKPVREQANALGLSLVLEVENPDICGVAPDYEEENEKGCENLHKIIDIVLKEYDFDGISLSVGTQSFKPEVVSLAKKYIDSIGKSTLKPRSLIATASQDFDQFDADVKVSNLLKSWDHTSTAKDIVKMIEASKGCTGWRLEDWEDPVIASKSRQVDTNLALHTVYLLPGTPIITYGTEAFINSDDCSPPVMPWNSSIQYPGASDECQVQQDVRLHNVERVSASGFPNSPYKLIRKLAQLRADNPIFTFGTLSSLQEVNDRVLYWEIREPLYPITVVMISIAKNGTVVYLDSPLFSDSKGDCSLKILYQWNTDWQVEDEIPCGGVYLKEGAVVALQSKTTLQKKDFAA